MHSFIIDTDNHQNHRHFLEQHRKDPVTGDSIQDRDEVVFCSGCKSVFLKDTWKYLEGRHCNQSKTLKSFPSNNDTLQIVPKDSVLFFSFLFLKKDRTPTLDKSIWNFSEEKPTFYTRLLSSVPFFFFVLFGYFLGFCISALLNTFLPILFSSVFMLLAIVLRDSHYKTQSEEENIYKSFKKDTFFISRLGVGFSSAYGIKKYLLPAHQLQSIKFYLFSKQAENTCTIKLKQGDMVKFDVKNFITPKHISPFFSAVGELNRRYKVPVCVEMDKSLQGHFQSAKKDGVSIIIRKD